MRPSIYLVFAAVIYPLFTSAQTKVAVSGTIGLYADFYKMNSDSTIAPRRPSELYRLVCSPTITYGDFSLPFIINISSQSSSVVTPVSKYKNFAQFLQSPINQVGIAPKYRWVQLLIGTQIPHYSELTFGDQPVFGAGLRLTPGKFRFEFFGGTSQQPIEEDTVHHIIGAYKRTLYSGKIGYGREDSSHIYLLSGYAIDDVNSLKVAPVNTLPANGLMLSLDYKVLLPKKFYVKGEIAGSLFSRDIRSRKVTDAAVPVPDDIFISRESTRSDGATMLTLGKDGREFGIKATGKYIGDGFVPLGYPFMQTDRLEVTIDPHFSLFKHKLNITGGGGERINNLSHTRGSTATQAIGYANVSAQITNDLNLSGNFSNFGFRNAVTNDSFRIQMVTMSYSFNPSYTLNLDETINVFSFTYGHDKFTDYNVISGSLNNNNSNSGMFIYNLGFTGNPFTTTLMASSFSNKLQTGTVTINSAGVTFGYGFWKNKLNLTAGETVSNALLDSKDPATQLLTTLGARYKIRKDLTFSLNASINDYRGGKTNPNYNFTEDLLRTSLIYKL
jgi:hypothetical protein